MTRAALCLAALVLVPVMVGPLPAAAAGPASITARLCNGGTVTIPLGPAEAPASERDCHPKGCHAGTCRTKQDPERPRRVI